MYIRIKRTRGRRNARAIGVNSPPSQYVKSMSSILLNILWYQILNQFSSDSVNLLLGMSLSFSLIIVELSTVETLLFMFDDTEVDMLLHFYTITTDVTLHPRFL